MLKTGLEDLKNKHRGEICYIVGKGFSLRNIKKEHFGEGIIITLNHAIIQIEKLGLTNQIYAMMEGDYGDFKPRKATILIRKVDTFLHGDKNLLTDYSPHYIYDPDVFIDTEPPRKEFSANRALKIAQLMGCSKIKLLCFDACTVGDLRGINGKKAARAWVYPKFCKRIYELIDKEKMDAEWIKP